jgi:hypothetical protein
MKKKRTGRIEKADDTLYRNDPDYQKALLEFGIMPAPSGKRPPPRTPPAPPPASAVVKAGEGVLPVAGWTWKPAPSAQEESEAATAPHAACVAAADVAAAPSGPSFWTSLIALPFQIIEYVVMAITVLLEILAGWAGITPIIWICNLFFHTKIPGIEVPIIFLIGYLVKGFFKSLGWWVGN